MDSIELSGLLVQPIARRVSDGVVSGKLDEDDLERALSADARNWVDHVLPATDWAPLQDVEGLVGLVAAQLGGETGLVAEALEECLVGEVRVRNLERDVPIQERVIGTHNDAESTCTEKGEMLELP